jgi:Brp/Blh family beta-carotene 15,15'-monooxygenase
MSGKCYLAMRWANWAPAPQRYSYAVMLAAIAVGLLAPRWAAWLLGPALLVGVVLLGLAHGACDQFVVPATHPALATDRLRYWVGFLGGYLGLAAGVGLLWWWQPAVAVALFFGLTAWHWGSADASAQARYRSQWLAHSLLRGGLLFAVPLLRWPTETAHVVNGLLALVGAPLVSATAVAQAATLLGPVVLVGHLLLWGSYWVTGQGKLACTDAAEVVLLSILLVALPPVLSAGVYFVFWHSLQHVLRMTALMGQPDGRRQWALSTQVGFFLRRAAPLLLVSVAGLVVLYSQPWVRAGGSSVLLSLALLVASVVTLPHTLLVTLGLDAMRWRQVPTARAATGTA